GGGAVPGYVVGLLRDLLDQLGADLLVRLLKLDLLGDAHTVVGNGGSTPLLLEYDVAPLRAQRHPHGVGEVVHAPLKAAARLLIERDHLGHKALSSWTLARRTGCCSRRAALLTHLRARCGPDPPAGPDSPRRPAPCYPRFPGSRRPHRPDLAS